MTNKTIITRTTTTNIIDYTRPAIEGITRTKTRDGEEEKYLRLAGATDSC